MRFASASALVVAFALATGCRTDSPSAAGPAGPTEPTSTRSSLAAEVRALRGELQYAETQDGKNRLRATGPLGGPSREVTKEPGGLVPFPGNQTLVISSGHGKAAMEQLALVDKGSVRYLGSAAGLVRNPALDRGGRHAVYESNKLSFRDIYRVDLADGKETRLTSDGDGAFAPTLSPDGARVAFVTTASGQADLHVMDVSGANRRPLVASPAHEASPAWSPDGMMIAFSGDRLGPERIFVVPATGGEPRRLTDTKQETAHEINPVWSPTGKHVAYLQHHSDGTSELWVATWPGGERTRVSRAKAHAAYPAWAPTGAFLWYSDRSGDSLDLWVARRDGSERLRITETPADEWLPQWRAAARNDGPQHKDTDAQ